MNNFRTLITRKSNNDTYINDIELKNIDWLGNGDVLIKVKYSSLNFKDALSAIGNKGVTKKYPHTPGIDAAGIVVESENDKFSVGDKVIVTGYDFGMNTNGGFSEYIRVPSEWIVKLPKQLSLRESMIYGTAGFTAALSVKKLLDYGIKQNNGPVLVTGATGGVGSIAVSILSKLQYTVIGLTGKPEYKDMLLKAGAKDIVLRKDFNDASEKILLSTKWNAVVDTVGGNLLENALKTTKYNGCVTCCGNVASYKLSTTVYPFILRGISLLGIDSVQCPMDIREKVWEKLSTDWKINNLNDNVEEISLEQVDVNIQKILQGKLKGRTIINLAL
ncbi:YhdH/YhfP family quinone oxidoreductase [Pectinatus brassicae]|uniref:Putative YhdH/YhfP family quinone oxidoreductase n=1 Tax=Pectinatus brassicae TaxID=862415 RepID=A0A840UJD9_9FIRM|nr:YhdH/YhfP family quinone oxidoreductase [Pectinatus brassicae]MBB5337109.1 putative YhdH/YhfP family quinone oxidoreductase [Pectinatus brassicae]